MTARKAALFVTIATCIVGLSLLGAQKKLVERPLKGRVHNTVIVSLIDGSFEGVNTGNATHFGLHTVVVEGTMDLVSGEASGTGIGTAANGDQFFVEMLPDGTTSITGGTGRFEGATGRVWSKLAAPPVVIVDPNDQTMTIDQDGILNGWIAY